MRICQRKQVGEFVRLLEDVHNEIKRALDCRNIEMAMELMRQCQDGAFKLGTLIETVEGKGLATIVLLEDYCELTYRIFTEILKNSSVNSEDIYKNLKKSLSQIENSIKKDIKICFEVVFFPYKASMWDSLESVWKAAEADEECDAYVVPIPYYDKTSCGKYGEEHWEGDQFPDYVPITRYNEYDFVSRRPDIIFIHNPYDNWNHVTSVHPLFYAENLRCYTDNLVYIPYFIFREFENNTIDSKTLLKWVESFCIVPGVIYADKVIVQSEFIRKLYINNMMERTDQSSREYWEKKILGLGSPKIDKISNVKKEKMEIPEEWMEAIQKPDGSWKKIVLYNTGINTLLKYNEKALIKMGDVFKVFEIYQDDVVLLWRPHPLIKTTIEAMRPQLLNQYQGLIQKYNKNNCEVTSVKIEQNSRIFDDTPDLHRAINLSDAYIGDTSSLIPLYQKAGKPIMIQNIEVACSSVCPCIVYEDEKFIWLSETEFAALYKFGKKSASIEQMFCFGEDDNFEGYYFYHATKLNGKIYFSPLRSKQIGVFDERSGGFSYISFDDSFDGPAFWGSFAYGENIFFVPMNYPAIMKLNTMTLEIQFITDWVKRVDDLMDSPNTDILCTLGVQIDNDTFSVASARANALIVFNMKTEKATVYEVGKKEWRYIDLCFDGESYWLLPRFNSPVVKWNPKTNETITYSKFICDLEDHRPWFGFIEYFEGQIWILPKIANFGIVIEPETGEMRIAEEIKDVFGLRRGSTIKQTCIMSWVNDTSLYLYDSVRGELVEWSNNNLKRKKILPPEGSGLSDRYGEVYKKYERKQNASYAAGIMGYRLDHMSKSEIELLHRSVQNEREELKLSHFLELEVINCKNKKEMKISDNASVGREIYKYLKIQLLGGERE